MVYNLKNISLDAWLIGNMDLTNFFTIHINTAYFLCCCPFRIVRFYTKKSSSTFFISKSCWAQKLVCGISMVLGLFWIFSEILNNIPHDFRNPSMYFHFVLYILSGLQKWHTLKSFWMQQDIILKIVNFVAENQTKLHSQKSSIWVARKSLVCLMCLINVIIAICAFMSGVGLEKMPHEGDRESWILMWTRNLEATGRKAFFLKNRNLNLSGFEEAILVFISVIGYFHRRVMGVIADISIVMPTLMLWSFARIMAINLENGRETCNWPHLQAHFHNLKQLAHLVNKLICERATGFIIGTVLYYSSKLEGVFLQAGLGANRNLNDNSIGDLIVTGMQVVLALLNGGTILYFAADIENQVCKFACHLQKVVLVAICSI